MDLEQFTAAEQAWSQHRVWLAKYETIAPGIWADEWRDSDGVASALLEHATNLLAEIRPALDVFIGAHGLMTLECEDADKVYDALRWGVDQDAADAYMVEHAAGDGPRDQHVFTGSPIGWDRVTS